MKRTIYLFDDFGNKIPVGSYTPVAIITVKYKYGDDSTEYPVDTGYAIDPSGTYNIGESCTIVASDGMPGTSFSNHYAFKYWEDSEGNHVGTDYSGYTFTVTEDAKYCAVYELEDD